MPEYEIRPFAPSRVQDVVSLHAHLIRADAEHRRRYLEWKYLENPFIQPPNLVLAYLNDEVAGMRGTFGSKWRPAGGGEPVVLPHADDLAIHPEHRSRGLFLPLMEALIASCAERGYDQVIGLCGGLTTQELALATGWTSVGDIERHARTSRVADLRRGSPFLRKTARRLRKIRRLGRPPPPAGRIPEENEVDWVAGRIMGFSRSMEMTDEAFVDATADLVRQAAAPTSTRLFADRGSEYLRWRLANPDRRYRILSWIDGASRAYLILSWPTADPRYLQVADYAATDDGAFEGLIGALSSVRSLETILLSSRLSGARLRTVEAFGFVPLLDTSLPGQRRRFLITDTRSGEKRTAGRRASTLDEWDFNLLETMAV